jgi:hypothetical protein
MTATDIFSNTGGSVDWYEFLNFIGEKVRLKGWNRFAGGLDVKTDTTGTATLSLSLSPLPLPFAPLTPSSPHQIR